MQRHVFLKERSSGQAGRQANAKRKLPEYINLYQLIYGKEYCFDSLWRRQRPQRKLMRKLFAVFAHISPHPQRCVDSPIKANLCGDRVCLCECIDEMEWRKKMRAHKEPDAVICGVELAKGWSIEEKKN